MRTRCSGGAHSWTRLARAHARHENRMGADLTLSRALALYAANRWPFPMELSLAAILSFGPRDLCSGSVAIVPGFAETGIGDPGCSCACFGNFDRRRNFDLPYRRAVRLSISLDCYRTCCALVPLGIFITGFQISAMRACYDYVLRVVSNISLHPNKLRCSHI